MAVSMEWKNWSSSPCNLCPRNCQVNRGQGQKGFCGMDDTVRLGRAALHLWEEPCISGKNGSGTVFFAGCNLRCVYCQNHEISMAGPEEAGAVSISPEALAQKAEEYKAIGNIGAAFTYNEPLVGWEYVRDSARLSKELGMDNVLVTNGTASREVLEELLPLIDAMNIDLKAFREETYRKLGGDLKTVKEFITRAAADCHVELTTLIVPGMNDGTEEMEEEARWIASLGKDIPLHVTRFFPRYQMADRDATETGRVYRLADTARKYLEHVFVGNC